MNETLNSLKTRWSIRSYLPKQVDKGLSVNSWGEQ